MNFRMSTDRVFSLVCLFFIIVFILIGYFWYADTIEMRIQECQITNESKPVMYFQTIYGSKGEFLAMIPVQYFEYKYVCKDHDRWR
jgi:TRAP-type C4-dicarboxylate transport system permease small subunit